MYGGKQHTNKTWRDIFHIPKSEYNRFVCIFKYPKSLIQDLHISTSDFNIECLSDLASYCQRGDLVSCLCVFMATGITFFSVTKFNVNHVLLRSYIHVDTSLPLRNKCFQCLNCRSFYFIMFYIKQVVFNTLHSDHSSHGMTQVFTNGVLSFVTIRPFPSRQVVRLIPKWHDWSRRTLSQEVTSMTV